MQHDIVSKAFNYIERMLDNLCKKKWGSKRWWRVANQIMETQGCKTAIPALKGADVVWVRDLVDEANLLARSFSTKFTLPDIVWNEFYFDGPYRTTDESVFGSQVTR